MTMSEIMSNCPMFVYPDKKGNDDAPLNLARIYASKGVSYIKIKRMLKGKYPELTQFELREIVRVLRKEKREENDRH